MMQNVSVDTRQNDIESHLHLCLQICCFFIRFVCLSSLVEMMWGKETAASMKGGEKELIICFKLLESSLEIYRLSRLYNSMNRLFINSTNDFSISKAKNLSRSRTNLHSSQMLTFFSSLLLLLLVSSPPLNPTVDTNDDEDDCC